MLWVAIMFHTPNCPDGGDWTKQGWLALAPGQTKVASAADVSSVNQYWCYYAIADDGAYWAGEYSRMVTDRVFDLCEWTSSTDAYEVGFRLLDVGDADDCTVILTA